jgi:hypothetical protein
MRSLVFIAIIGAAACASSTAPDPGLEGLSITSVAPGTIIPGTKIVVKGASFVDEQWGAATLRLKGRAGGTEVDESWPATFVDFSTLTVEVDSSMIDTLGGNTDFSGDIFVEFVATTDGNTYATGKLSQTLQFRTSLTPNVTGVVDGVIFVNDQIEVDGDGFLLGGAEGTTYARLEGCFQPDSSSFCDPIATTEVALQPRTELSRTEASFPFSPKIAGIRPGSFIGQVVIVNKHMNGGGDVEGDPIEVTYDLVTSQVFSTEPASASLGQYVFVKGGGFVGGEAGALTQLELDGMFNKTGMPAVHVVMNLIPEYVEGRLVRYVLNTDDEIGQAIDLRTETGRFSGTITPIVEYDGDSVRGVSTETTFDIAPVKQIVYLDYTPSYVEGLRDFGLRAVDNKIRDRILEVLNRTYEGVNIEFRSEPPTDFALYELVTLVGVDPNNMGLFGYDNTPGKDNGNVRLYDKLGGVNAQTQQDGYPGYGGVFLRSLMGFSEHPGDLALMVPGADPIFDEIFDPFRDDRGDPVTSSDLTSGFSPLASGDSCPGSDRTGKLQCAVFVLGNLVGGTLAHELGHSLGLANPYGDGFHDNGDAVNRLMDAGGDRSFLERAELMGEGPGVFCDDEYTYLRQILPSSQPAPNVTRPSCF